MSTLQLERLREQLLGEIPLKDLPDHLSSSQSPLTTHTMAEQQPPNVVEGATTGDIDEEVPIVAKSAEERKAAAALSALDSKDDDSSARDVDQEAVRKAMDRLAVSAGPNGTVAKTDEKKVVKKVVKVDAADVALLVCLFNYALG